MSLHVPINLPYPLWLAAKAGQDLLSAAKYRALDDPKFEGMFLGFYWSAMLRAMDEVPR